MGSGPELSGGACVIYLFLYYISRWPAAEKEAIDAELLRKYIFAGHVQEYMEVMEEDDEEGYKTHFAKYIESDVTAENMEDTWTEVHKQIRDKPEQVLTKKTEGRQMKSKKRSKLSAAQRRDRVAQKIASHVKKLSNA